jgi:hypothetical protein
MRADSNAAGSRLGKCEVFARRGHADFNSLWLKAEDFTEVNQVRCAGQANSTPLESRL